MSKFVQLVTEDERFDKHIGDSVFNLRRFDSEVYRKIKQKHTKKYFRRGQQIVEIDEDAINDDLLDYMIIGWGIVKHPVTGEKTICTRENKLRLPGSVKVELVEACDQDSIVTEVKEKLEKNLQSSSSSK
jgi:hypothetical protein